MQSQRRSAPASRCTRGGRSPTIAFQKAVVDIGVDPVQPLFGTFGPLLIGLSLGFELRNSRFGGAQLVRKLLRSIKRVLAVGF